MIDKTNNLLFIHILLCYSLFFIGWCLYIILEYPDKRNIMLPLLLLLILTFLYIFLYILK